MMPVANGSIFAPDQCDCVKDVQGLRRWRIDILDIEADAPLIALTGHQGVQRRAMV
jgi:hypothetical protein